MAKSKAVPRLYRFLVYFLPVALYFSYFPVIGLGGDGTMNFELSVPLIWLVVFDAVVVILLSQKKLWRGVRERWAWLLLPIFLSLSVIWSANVLRGFLTVGVVWLVYLAGYGMFALRELFDENGCREKFWKVFFGSALVMCGVLVVQCVLDLAGVGREVTQMCEGCVYSAFGFPHPNGFAIEPQFMGNLLLAPTIISMYGIIQEGSFRRRGCSRPFAFGNSRPKGRALRGSRRSSSVVTSGMLLNKPSCIIFISLALATTLFLTFSRGAIYAFVIAMIMMVVVMGVKYKVWKRGLVVLGLMVVAFLMALNLQGIMAAVSKTDDTYWTGVSKAMNHLSLGTIELDAGAENRGSESEEDGSESEKHETENLEENTLLEEGSENHTVEFENYSPEAENLDAEVAVFDGYVAESTNVRIELTNAAVQVWAKDFATIMFGVGLGGAGQALYDNGLTESPKEIVQNEYASLLLETGVVGILLVIFSLGLALKAMRKSPAKIMLFALVVAYMVSLGFFAGLANALQIYLVPVVVYVVVGRKVPE